MLSENSGTLFVIAGVLLLSVIGWLIASIQAHRKTKLTTTAENDALNQTITTLKASFNAAQAEVQQLCISGAEQDANVRHLSEQLHVLQTEKSILELRVQEIAQQKTEAEQKAAVSNTELSKDREAHTERMQIIETLKTEAIIAAKAATLESATQLSSKLIDDHKRQSNEAKKETEERVKKTTDALVAQITEVSKNIYALNSDVSTNRNTMDTVMRALSSPGGAGQFAEIGLENTLTSFGLLKGRDFSMQHHLEDTGLRPDALVFLPGDAVLVIDSKASKFLLDLEEATTKVEEAGVYSSLAKTMNMHLKSLSGKNYKTEVIAQYQASGREQRMPRVVSVMFIPNEGAIEKVTLADPTFLHKAAKLQITVAGPAALACLIGFARVELDVQRQSENQERIVEGAQKIVESIGVIVEKIILVGKGLKSATKNYNDLTGSMNSRLLPRIRQMVSYGVQSNRHKQIPVQVPTFSFTEHERGDLIEGDSEEIEKTSLLTNQTNPDALPP